ncbi:cytochrome p450 [Colletotrichum plurivorum]|uniref:Cytochrome p450 n=1 Tax=Colletotrichum plurivorum TaxID=2175906 RepID=A0A8H6K573_9PEZI|nr:cytochrome p450 [Colletotrichum plurivorum]
MSTSIPWGPSALAAYVAVAAVLLYILRLLALPKPLQGIPYNEEAAVRVFGDIPSLRAVPSRRDWFSATLRRHNSPLVQLFFLPFSKPIVICADPVEIQDICMRRTKEFKRSSIVSAIFCGAIPNHHITMADDDPRFKKNRELVRDLMTPAFLHEVSPSQHVSAPQVYDKATRLLELWALKSRLSGGRPFEAGKDVHNTALDIITSVAFDLDESTTVTAGNIAHFEKVAAPVADSKEDPEEPVDLPNQPLSLETQSFNIITEMVGSAFKAPHPRFKNWQLRRTDHVKAAFAATQDMSNRELSKAVARLEAEEPPRCAMDQIILRERSIAGKEGREPDYYSEAIKDELLGYLVAGHETTSSAFRWGLKFISRDQAVQSRLRSALRSAFPDAVAANRPPTAHEILRAHVPYFDAVVEEILRCCRTLPITSREALVDTQILGRRIPKGTLVMFLANGPGYLHPAVPVDEASRSTDSAKHAAERAGVWDPANVRDFVPERWLKTVPADDDGPEREVFDANAGPFMTFGHGPRACFGKRLSYIEMRFMLCLLVWRFELQTVDTRWDTSEATEMFTTDPKECYVKLKQI